MIRYEMKTSMIVIELELQWESRLWWYGSQNVRGMVGWWRIRSLFFTGTKERDALSIKSPVVCKSIRYANPVESKGKIDFRTSLHSLLNKKGLQNPSPLNSCPGKTMVCNWHCLFKQCRDSLEASLPPLKEILKSLKLNIRRNHQKHRRVVCYRENNDHIDLLHSKRSPWNTILDYTKN